MLLSKTCVTLSIEGYRNMSGVDWLASSPLNRSLPHWDLALLLTLKGL